MKSSMAGRVSSVPPDLLALLDEHLAPALTDGTIRSEVSEATLVGIARELLGRPGKQFRARLVELAFELAGGEVGELCPVIPQLVEIVHAGSLIVDDIQDDSPERRGGPALHRLYGVPLAINTGNWLYFAAYHLIDRTGLTEGAALEIYRRLTRTMFRSHQGQALDLAIDVTAMRQRDVLELAEAAAALKAGELMSFAAALGGLAAGAILPTVESLARFGAALGVGLQHLDDAGGLRGRRDKGREDLAGHRLTWPWACLAGELDTVGFTRLQHKLRDARDGDLDELIDELAGLLGEDAHHRAHVRLDGARVMLTEQFAGHPALSAVDAELARLERAYA